MRTEESVRPTHLAAMLDVAGRDVLIVGGGMVAARRAAALLDAGADVRVVSPVLTEALRARLAGGEIAWSARGFRPGDCQGAFLVVVATDDPAVNAGVAADARTSGALINDAEVPGRGDLHIPAVLHRGRLQVAVGSGGAGPVLAAFVRDKLAERLGPEFARLAELAAGLRGRDRVAPGEGPTRKKAIASALPQLLALLESGQDAEAERLVAELGSAAQPAGEPAWS